MYSDNRKTRPRRSADRDLLERLVALEERSAVQGEEIERGRATREVYVPRIIEMENAVMALRESVPQLTAVVDGLTRELEAQRVSRKVITKLAAWGLAILTAVIIAILSDRAIAKFAAAKAPVSVLTPAR